MTDSSKVRARLPRAEVSYTSGFSTNPELLIGPWFAIFGILMSLLFAFVPGEPPRTDQPPPPPEMPYFPLIFVAVGLVACYIVFFRRVYRIEIQGEMLCWFLPFRRLKGQASIADIVSIWTDGTLQRRVTRTGFDMRDDTTFSIRDRRGISAFVAQIIDRSPRINLSHWEPHEPGGSQSIGSLYVNEED